MPPTSHRSIHHVPLMRTPLRLALPLLLMLPLAGCCETPQTALARAAAAGDHVALSALIAVGDPLDERDADGNTALIWACRSGRTDCALTLVDAGADIDAPDGREDLRWTPLMNALHAGEVDTACALLARGADPNRAGSSGLTPLIIAASDVPAAQRLAIVVDLLEAGADPRAETGNGTTALSVAFGRGDEEVAQRLLDVAPDLRLPDGLASSLALFVACLRGDVAVAGWLSPAEDGWPPLMQAIAGGRPEQARRLLDEGADANAVAPNGRTALMLAAAAGDAGLVAGLLEHGADPRAQELDQLNALTHALDGGSAEVARLLLAAAPDLRLACVMEDVGALWGARVRGDSEILQVLDEAGALPGAGR